MMTLRQIERLWNDQAYERLWRELIAARPEASFRLEVELGRAIPAAAIAIIRLDELSQSQHPLCMKLVRQILVDQRPDGGWDDPMTSSLCLRALMTCQGQGVAVDRGLFYLASMQKSEGIWPKVPFRRMPADPFVSAFILYHLGDDPRFRSAVRFLDAVNWFEAHETGLDVETRRLWDRAAPRCHLQRVRLETLVWS